MYTYFKVGKNRQVCGSVLLDLMLNLLTYVTSVPRPCWPNGGGQSQSATPVLLCYMFALLWYMQVTFVCLSEMMR
jgi:hypothetical protein